ncbi:MULTISPECIES: hypothetical protein [Acinetobacter]|uniref:hypothetical protein n=1 Tax=Acinetobacter TaxID=469 RepID=UPI0002F64F59|nr:MULTISPECIES: hypothetical protein [Acinetobacter]OTT97799.1 hypothetical protein CAT67_16835 [Acinetobacter baumannii]
MSTELVNSANIIPFPKPCTFCESTEHVQLFAGVMMCKKCQENIRITNPGLFAANEQIEQKTQD